MRDSRLFSCGKYSVKLYFVFQFNFSLSATTQSGETLNRNAFDIFLLQIYKYILIVQQKLFLFLNIVAEVNPNTINSINSIPYINQLFSVFFKTILSRIKIVAQNVAQLK